MFQSIGLINGFIFIQGMLNREVFHIVEANYRVEAGLWYRFTVIIHFMGDYTTLLQTTPHTTNLPITMHYRGNLHTS